MNVIFLPNAQHELLEQQTYLSNHASETVAVGFIDSVQESTEHIAAFPRSGRLILRERSGYEVRSWPVAMIPDIRLYYRILENGVEIMRVWHEKRDPSTLSLSESPAEGSSAH